MDPNPDPKLTKPDPKEISLDGQDWMYALVVLTGRVQDLYHLECYIADCLNERKERKKIYTEGIFSAGSTAELGDKAGFVAARFIRSASCCTTYTGDIRVTFLPIRCQSKICLMAFLDKIMDYRIL
jgi:hypothetical protein